VQKILIVLVALLSGCVTNQVKDSSKAVDKSYQTFNYEIPDAMSKQVEEVLSKFKGNILSVEGVEQINLDDIGSGYVLEYKSTSAERLVYTFTRKHHEYAYFELVTHLDGEAYPSIFRTNGIKGEVASIEKTDSYSPYPLGENDCKYVLGKCEYKTGTKIRKVNTSFASGVWTTTKPMGRFGIGYLVTKKIYDSNGILLYRGSFSNQWANGEHSYTVRVK